MESVLRAVGQAASRAADHIEKSSSDPRNDRTEIGAPKIETGYYSSGKMQGFGSDGRTYRPDAPAGGSYSSRMPGYGREDDTRGGLTRLSFHAYRTRDAVTRDGEGVSVFSRRALGVSSRASTNHQDLGYRDPALVRL